MQASVTRLQKPIEIEVDAAAAQLRRKCSPAQISLGMRKLPLPTKTEHRLGETRHIAQILDLPALRDLIEPKPRRTANTRSSMRSATATAATEKLSPGQVSLRMNQRENSLRDSAGECGVKAKVAAYVKWYGDTGTWVPRRTAFTALGRTGNGIGQGTPDRGNAVGRLSDGGLLAGRFPQIALDFLEK